MALPPARPAIIGIKAPFPGVIEPALASSIEKVPSGERWIHEVKFDGYRVQVHLANKAVKVFTRRGHDWTHRFKKVAAVLQKELKSSSNKIVLVVFDLLHLKGGDFRKEPLFRRKAELKKIIAGTDVQFSESFEIDGKDMFARAARSVWRAWCRRSATAPMRAAATTTG